MSNNYDEIKEALQKLQEKVEILEKENQELKSGTSEVKEPEENNKHFEFLDKAGNLASDEMDKIFEENSEIIATSMCITKTKIPNFTSGTTMSSSCIDSFDEISEEGLSAALEVFTNPRRINILKVLMSQPLTATEITQKTGLVGGQLYHHLSNLENAGLIIKENEKYRNHPDAPKFLICLYAALGGMKIARNG